MSEQQLYGWILNAYLALAALIFLFSLFTTAPYGRYGRPSWSGPELPSWLGWMLMELPQPVGFLLCFVLSHRQGNLVAQVFLGMWMFHYIYRTFIYPFLPRASSMSLAVVGMGFLLNIGFSYLNGRWLFAFGPLRDPAWLTDPRFVGGTLLFFGGFTLCSSSDAILRRLRRSSERTYRIPAGGAYRWVSCPNYLGEIVQWSGWAIATWSLAGATIALITSANLIPRARVNHRWYRENLPGYPAGRRALIPYLF
jgi:protein-S-isoprenylcysteine O-methyltransferase Ste14